MGVEGRPRPSFVGVQIRASPRGARLRLRVTAGARVSQIEGEHAGALKISVIAAPEKGKANQEVERVLAEGLGLSRSSVKLLSGHASRTKLVEISALSPDEVKRRLERLPLT